MSSQSDINIYASAIHAFSLNSYETVQQFFDGVSYALQHEPGVNAFLSNPRYSNEEKTTALCRAARNKLAPEIESILLELIAKGKTGLIPQIGQLLVQIHQAHADMQTALVSSALELSHKQKEILEKKIGAVLGKSILIKWLINPGLIAGFQIQIGNRYLDTSVQRMMDDTITYLQENIRG